MSRIPQLTYINTKYFILPLNLKMKSFVFSVMDIVIQYLFFPCLAVFERHASSFLYFMFSSQQFSLGFIPQNLMHSWDGILFFFSSSPILMQQYLTILLIHLCDQVRSFLLDPTRIKPFHSSFYHSGVYSCNYTRNSQNHNFIFAIVYTYSFITSTFV